MLTRSLRVRCEQLMPASFANFLGLLTCLFWLNRNGVAFLRCVYRIIPQVKGHMAALAAFSEHMCGPEHVRCFGGSRLRRVVSVLSVPASLQCSILLKLQLHRQNDRTAWSYSESTEELQFRGTPRQVRRPVVEHGPRFFRTGGESSRC